MSSVSLEEYFWFGISLCVCVCFWLNHSVKVPGWPDLTHNKLQQSFEFIFFLFWGACFDSLSFHLSAVLKLL